MTERINNCDKSEETTEVKAVNLRGTGAFGIVSMLENTTGEMAVANCDCDKGCDCFDTGPGCFDICDRAPDRELRSRVSNGLVARLA